MEICKILEKDLVINPKNLNSDISSFLSKLVEDSFVNVCTEEGLIMSIIKILKITNVISRDAKTVVFKVVFEAKVIQIEKNIKVFFKPTLIIQKGIFGKMTGSDTITFLIPAETSLKEWVFINDTFKRGKKSLTKNTFLTAVITDVRFDSEKRDLNDKITGGFNCICRLENKDI
jgi:hypothetical protein